MKQKPFCYLSGFIMITLSLAFVIASCTKKASDVVTISDSKEVASAKASKPGSTTTEVRLKLTVSDGSGNQITSDGKGTYVDGQQNSSIYFSTSGNLQFSTHASNNPNTLTTRWLNVNFNSPLPDYPVSGFPARGIEKSNFISTQTGTGPDPTALQNLARDATKCITFSAGFMTITGGVLNFHRSPTEDNSGTKSSYVYVTRTKVSSVDGIDEWLMTPAPPSLPFVACSLISNVGALRINGTLSGYYNMPFSFTLTKL